MRQQPAVPVPTWFATINVARQPQIACLPLICLYIHSLLSFVYIDQNAIIECRGCGLVREQPESDSSIFRDSFSDSHKWVNHVGVTVMHSRYGPLVVSYHWS